MAPVSPYRLVLGQEPGTDRPWILEVWRGGELQALLRFEKDDERNEIMRLFQEPGEYPSAS